MAKITCPNCGRSFDIEDSEYNALLSHIENDEIEKRVKKQIDQMQEILSNKYDSKLKDKDFKNQLEITRLETEINLLNQKIANSDKDKQLEIERIKSNLKDEFSKKENVYKEQLSKNQIDYARLESSFKDRMSEKELNYKKTLGDKELELQKLNNEIDSVKKDAQINENKLIEDYKIQLGRKDELIERYKSYSLKDSTKDIGESLEQYCYNEFQKIRATAFPNAYFEKDNIADENGKGDFIFRDFSNDGIEYVSIMFEMKNEKDTTATKHKNTDFLDKLDRNRKFKNCEYAVLVTMLEADNDLYNHGIVDVSYAYEKMYIIRPKDFISLIGILRNANKDTIKYIQEIKEYKEQNLDITNFEDKVNAIGSKIQDDYEKANTLYSTVEKQCDDLIAKITKFKETFRKAALNMEKATKEVSNLEIRKLTYGNKTMKKKFAEVDENKKLLSNDK